MRHRVTPRDLKITAEQMQRQGLSKWWVCNEYRLRGHEIVASHSPPWMLAPDSPPGTGEEELHWRSYEPLEETPDLFLKLARLHQQPDFGKAALAFSHRYGLLGGNSTKEGFGQPYRDNLRNFKEESERAWTVLKMYEAVLNRDWMAAKSLLTAETYGAEDYWPFEVSSDAYLLWALHSSTHMVTHTVQNLCRPTLRFVDSSWAPKVDPYSVERAWWFDNLLGAAYLQMYWLMTSNGEFTRCKYCGQVISLAKPHPDGRKRRSDKRFCDDACRQANHRHK